jgi:hypothetical protein
VHLLSLNRGPSAATHGLAYAQHAAPILTYVICATHVSLVTFGGGQADGVSALAEAAVVVVAVVVEFGGVPAGAASFAHAANTDEIATTTNERTELPTKLMRV